MMEMVPIHFIRPFWLTALPLAVILPLLWHHLRRPSGDWGKICDNHLLRWLSVGDATAKRSKTGPWLAGLVWAIAAIALAGPSWQKLPDSSFTARDARVLVLDLSLSMLAEDLKPNRLTQAHFRLSDMLDEALEGQTGLVAYAGDAFVVSPLTSDTNTIRNMLPALRPDVIPVSGSRPDKALELAAQLLKRSGLAKGEILLIADSGNPATAAVAADLAKPVKIEGRKAELHCPWVVESPFCLEVDVKALGERLQALDALRPLEEGRRPGYEEKQAGEAAGVHFVDQLAQGVEALITNVTSNPLYCLDFIKY